MKWYRDIIIGCLVSENTLRDEFNQMEKEEKNERTFEQYLNDCANKNGFLEFVVEV